MEKIQRLDWTIVLAVILACGAVTISGAEFGHGDITRAIVFGALGLFCAATVFIADRKS